MINIPSPSPEDYLNKAQQKLSEADKAQKEFLSEIMSESDNKLPAKVITRLTHLAKKMNLGPIKKYLDKLDNKIGSFGTWKNLINSDKYRQLDDAVKAARFEVKLAEAQVEATKAKPLNELRIKEGSPKTETINKPSKNDSTGSEAAQFNEFVDDLGTRFNLKAEGRLVSHANSPEAQTNPNPEVEKKLNDAETHYPNVIKDLKALLKRPYQMGDENRELKKEINGKVFYFIKNRSGVLIELVNKDSQGFPTHKKLELEAFLNLILSENSVESKSSDLDKLLDQLESTDLDSIEERSSSSQDQGIDPVFVSMIDEMEEEIKSEDLKNFQIPDSELDEILKPLELNSNEQTLNPEIDKEHEARLKALQDIQASLASSSSTYSKQDDSNILDNLLMPLPDQAEFFVEEVDLSNLEESEQIEQQRSSTSSQPDMDNSISKRLNDITASLSHNDTVKQAEPAKNIQQNQAITSRSIVEQKLSDFKNKPYRSGNDENHMELDLPEGHFSVSKLSTGEIIILPIEIKSFGDFKYHVATGDRITEEDFLKKFR